MTHIAVTFDKDRYKMDLAIPADVPAHLIAQSIAEKLSLSIASHKMFSLAIRMDNALKQIPPESTPADAGIFHGAFITLVSIPRSNVQIEENSAYLQFDGGGRVLLSMRTVIGRNDPKSNIVVDVDVSAYLDNPKIISRQHAEIEREGGQYYLKDLNSNNGTKLNGERLLPNLRRLLKNGDLIELGKNALRMIFSDKQKR